MPNVEVSKTRVLESLYGAVHVGAHGAGAAAAAPSEQAFIGATTLLTVNPETEDGFDFELVVPRSVETDVATITLTPVVRWTCIDTPTADQTVLWKLDYTYAMPTLAAETAADRISGFCDVRTMVTSVHTLTGAEYRSHMVTKFAAFDFPARNFKPSCLVVGNIRISSVSTVASSIVGMLAVGCAYLEGPSGTSSIVP